MSDRYAALMQTLSPVAYWPLWEAAGSATCADLASGPVTLTCRNGAAPGSAPLFPGGRGSTWFDGSNDYLDEASNASKTAIAGNLTILAWFAMAGTPTTPRLVSRRSGTQGYDLCIDNSSGQLVGFVGSAGGYSSKYGNADWRGGGVHLAAMVYDDTAKQLALYGDGKVDLAFTASPNGIIAPATVLQLGYWSGGGGATQWWGTMGHVALFNAVLTPAQIAAAWAAGKSAIRWADYDRVRR